MSASTSNAESGTMTLERGNIYFFYRPRVEEDEPESPSDLQRLYMVLHPANEDRYRIAVIGRKVLPDSVKSGKDRFWGFVETVRKDPKSIRKELGEEEYGTKTRGKRHLPAARPAGEGVYRILRHDDHTHFVYALELPRVPGEVQQEIHIEEEASFVISIANPERRAPRAAGLSEKEQAEYPKRLQDVFRGRKFADAEPPDFLNQEGCEFLLISASGDIEEELGIQLDTDAESASSADIFKDLRLDRSKIPSEPLLKGGWE